MTPKLSAFALALACAGSVTSAQAWQINQRPPVLRGPIAETAYDGVGDDLLTAGLGKTGLMAAAPPAFADPLHPTPAELRRNAIHTNYRALVDYTAAGGMGVFYGPNIDTNGHDTLGEGKVPGREYIAWADDGSGRRNVTLMVQVPDSFNAFAPCIVTATSSGSRGIYGAIGTAGEWGLKHGCAVAYTDKGSGNGLHDLMSNAVTLRDGTQADAAAAGRESLFSADLTTAQRAAFNAAHPDRVAYKHAHSKQNSEKDWGRNTLDAVRFAFYVLNERYGLPAPGGRHWRTIEPFNTVVIASSVSNGGGAALMAAEQDREGLIDGVAVSEPNVQPRPGFFPLKIHQGNTTYSAIGKPLVDYFTFANVYQPCALLAAGLSMNAALWPDAFTGIAANRCAALAAKGLVVGGTVAEQAADALAKMRAYGWLPQSDSLHQSLYRLTTNSIAVTYTNAYGRFGVEDRLCGFSFANTDAATGAPIAQNPAAQAGIFSTGNGIPPATGVNIVYDDSLGAPRLDFVAISPSTGQFDFALDGALCQRSLVTGRDAVTGQLLAGARRQQSDRIRNGIAQVQVDAALHGKPAIVVAGRDDGLLPINHAARAWYAKSQTDPWNFNVRYIEVTNAQHFDGFIAFGPLLGYDTRYVPLHVYFNRAMDAMWAHLKYGAPLPASQVVRTVPRGGSVVAPPLTGANVPPIKPFPGPADAIWFWWDTLYVPD